MARPAQRFRWPIALVVLLSSLSLPVAPAQAGHGGHQCGFQQLTGPACPIGGGLVRVLDEAGEELGVVHDHVDPILRSPTPNQPRTKPVCAAPGDPYVTRFIYAHSFELPNRYDSLAPTLRDAARIMTAQINASARLTGGTALLKVECDDRGQMVVHNRELPTLLAFTSFASIKSDLMVRGFSDPRAKLVVYYDGTDPMDYIPLKLIPGGLGDLFPDDRHSGAVNANNGNAGYPMMAVEFGFRIDSRANWYTMLHEWSHTMGAVQFSAPHTTNASHCIDGLDIMCYADRGSNGTFYTDAVCAAPVYDCNNDDYFHRDPPAGSYLDCHWNIGDSSNRYLVFDGPSPPSRCGDDDGDGAGDAGPVRPPVPVFSIDIVGDCRQGTYEFVHAYVAGPHAVHVTWDFGDGVKAEGTGVRHKYETSGVYSVRMTATNSDGSTSVRVMRVVACMGPGLVLPAADSCLGETVPFRLVTNMAATAVRWDLGDTTVVTDALEAVHRYEAAGSYALAVDVTLANGEQVRLTGRHVVLEGECVPNLDMDRDGVQDRADNCVSTPNWTQEDFDGDGRGDACDGRPSSDVVGADGAARRPAAQDGDGDGVSDGADRCPQAPDPGQADLDRDGFGDACDLDADGDGVLESEDNCDGLANDQVDADLDGVGDACEILDAPAVPACAEGCLDVKADVRPAAGASMALALLAIAALAIASRRRLA